jgi:hypothetical protein
MTLRLNGVPTAHRQVSKFARGAIQGLTLSVVPSMLRVHQEGTKWTDAGGQQFSAGPARQSLHRHWRCPRARNRSGGFRQTSGAGFQSALELS